MSSVGNGRKAIQIRYRFVQPKDTSVHVVQFMDQFHVRNSCNRADQEVGPAAAALLVRLIAKFAFCNGSAGSAHVCCRTNPDRSGGACGEPYAATDGRTTDADLEELLGAAQELKHACDFFCHLSH